MYKYITPRRVAAIAAVLAGGTFAGGCTDRQATSAEALEAVSMLVVSGSDQTAAPGSELAQPLVVRVVNGGNNGVPGRLVLWRVTQGGGDVYAGASITDGMGYARERWTLGPTAGVQEVEARAIDPTSGAKLSYGVFRALASNDPQPAPVSRVEVTPASATIVAGNNAQFTATTYDASGNVLSGRAITWSSSNTSVASVSQSGLVTGASAGSATISATSEGRTGTAAVTVTAAAPAPVASVTVTPSSSTINVGGTAQLTATMRDAGGNVLSGRSVTWMSSNTAVATVNSSGMVTGAAVGSATITATSEGRSGTASITVSSAPPPPPPGGVLFSSDWSGMLGNSATAVSDGGKWNQLICPADLRAQVLSIVPGSEAGWTATSNVMQVTNRGGMACGGAQVTGAVPQGTSFYIRMYIRVEDENQFNFHAVNLDQLSMQVPLWAIFDPVAGVDYNPKINFSGADGQNRRWKPQAKLRQRQWYRFEWHVEMVNASQMRARVWPRIYDMAGNLLYDASRFINIDQPGGPTLGQYYASGGLVRFTSLDNFRKFGLGYEGTAGATNQGRRWFYAAVEIRSDTWPGPVR